ncbi:iron complex transport system substrate-binding protein [Quadrisphaera granulorum]|uniref:Iron complex transport system substrate-binding protein n=1 Tax=Quadrisphaera granulorum TaxID=317664 RepID=A0A316A7Q7_9ACTN|nr:ABC transporter substrate-binding protein [Quadrisphaera granulorum]PWJ53643.1 iron complex transport system substrate-binding protein [Quadrisphaera granulorum]SZE96687.1 iron complex transport system substrate-binding protein [Quadrisphaera granulorum]
MSRPPLLVVALTAVAALLAGCSAAGASDSGASGAASSTAGAGTRTVASAHGDVTVPEEPQRVAAVSYDTTWNLMSLGVKPVTSLDYGPWIDEFSTEQQAFVEGVPTVGTFGEINVEAVTAAQPDLIIGTAEEVDEATYAQLSAVAPTVLVGGGSRGDWQVTTEQTAKAVGREAQWQESKAAFEQTRDRLKTQYADVIANNRWINFSLGDDASQFSVQQPTGATGNLLVNELGMTYGPGVPTDYNARGYASYPLEQLGSVFEGVTVALTFASADGSPNPGVQAIRDNPLFQRLPVAQSGHVYPMASSVTDYPSATAWLEELEQKVLSVL